MTAEIRQQRTADGSPTALAEWQAGWPVLAASLVGVGTTWIFFQLTASLFIVPMQHDLGWSRSELSLASWSGFGAALLLPTVGIVIDQIGARLVAIAGMVALILGYLMLSYMPASKPVYFTLALWMSFAGSISNSVIFARGLATWFKRGFGMAVGIMMSGPSIAAAVAIPVLSSIIATHGWRSGYVAMAGFDAVIGLPVILLLFRQRGDVQADDGRLSVMPYRQVAAYGPFWWLLAATAAAALPIGGFLGHLQPILAELGLTRGAAAGFGSVFVVSIGAGRILLGPLLDRFHAPLVTSVSLGLAAAGAAALWWLAAAGAGAGLIVIVAMIGLAQGAEADYLKFFAARLFGVALFGRIAAIMSMVASAGMALGGFMFAGIFDRFGSYAPALPISVALYLTGCFCFARIRMTPFISQLNKTRG